MGFSYADPGVKKTLLKNPQHFTGITLDSAEKPFVTF